MSESNQPTYRIAGRMSKDDLTVVPAHSQFARSIRRIFEQVRPRRIIETGTYRGTGTTTAIANALRELGLHDAIFHTIEVNPKNCQRAADNLLRAGFINLRLHNALSVPRALLPTIEQIDDAFVKNVEADQLIVDHEEADRAKLYHGETDFPNVPDDMLGRLLREFDYRPDFVLLDSGGHMGFIEFNYVIEQLRGECVIALDDVQHVKHHRSFQRINDDPRFQIMAAGEEKFGFCIARFQPDADAESNAFRKVA